mmetsp:Transcript_17220/g.39801  ORF Transcript_17220/g.39801 Transcript_17220/m.39801 type:complete len:92 (-) Transcript_17220:667-942(-)
MRKTSVLSVTVASIVTLKNHCYLILFSTQVLTFFVVIRLFRLIKFDSFFGKNATINNHKSTGSGVYTIIVFVLWITDNRINGHLSPYDVCD